MSDYEKAPQLFYLQTVVIDVWLKNLDSDGTCGVGALSNQNPLVQSLSRPNGSVTTYQYDQLNRLQGIINKDSAQSVISSYILYLQ